MVRRLVHVMSKYSEMLEARLKKKRKAYQRAYYESKHRWSLQHPTPKQTEEEKKAWISEYNRMYYRANRGAHVDREANELKARLKKKKRLEVRRSQIP